MRLDDLSDGQLAHLASYEGRGEGDSRAACLLGVRHHKRGDLDEASKWYGVAILIGQDPYAMELLRVIYNSRGETDRAEALRREAIEKSDSPSSHYNLGVVLSNRCAFDEAKRELERAWAGGETFALVLLADIALKEGRDEEAYALANEAFEQTYDKYGEPMKAKAAKISIEAKKRLNATKFDRYNPSQ